MSLKNTSENSSSGEEDCELYVEVEDCEENFIFLSPIFEDEEGFYDDENKISPPEEEEVLGVDEEDSEEDLDLEDEEDEDYYDENGEYIPRVAPEEEVRAYIEHTYSYVSEKEKEELFRMSDMFGRQYEDSIYMNLKHIRQDAEELICESFYGNFSNLEKHLEKYPNSGEVLLTHLVYELDYHIGNFELTKEDIKLIKSNYGNIDILDLDLEECEPLPPPPKNVERMINCILEKGGDPSKRYMGYSPAELALSYSNNFLLRKFLEHITSTDFDFNITVFFFDVVMDRIQEGNFLPEMMTELIRFGFDLHLKVKDEKNFLESLKSDKHREEVMNLYSKIDHGVKPAKRS